MNHSPDLDPDAPPELITLATNINEILSSIESIRGPGYNRLLTIFFSLKQQVDQLESICCKSTTFIGLMCKDHTETDPAALESFNTAETNHAITHVLGSAINDTLNVLIHDIESIPDMHGITKDIELLMQRVNNDWKKHHE